MKDWRFAKFVVFVNCLVPLALLLWDAWWGQLGADAANTAIHRTGMLALVFLILSLTITPARKITGYNWLSHFRRMLGLYAFFYGSVHLLIYFGLDRGFSLGGLLEDVFKRKFIFFGMSALLLMVPLAITSTNGMIKRLGAAKWKRLHQLVYLSAIGAVVHFWMSKKKDVSMPELFVVALGVLFLYRIYSIQQKTAKKALPGMPSQAR